jgi:hypothetical protein
MDALGKTVQWYELDGLGGSVDVAIDSEGREWVMIAEADFHGHSIARVRGWEQGRGLMVGTITDRVLTSVIACTERDILQVEREGEEGILLAASAHKRFEDTIRRAGGRIRRLHPRAS